MSVCRECEKEGQHPICDRAAEDARRHFGCVELAPLRFMIGKEREFIALVHPGAARACGFAVEEYI